MKTDEEAAEDFAEKAYPIILATNAEKAGIRISAKYQIKQTFLAGCNHARKATWINPQDESTWPPLKELHGCILTDDGEDYWKLHLCDWGMCDVKTIIELGKGTWTHWWPLPAVREEKS